MPHRPVVFFVLLTVFLGLALGGCSSDEITDPGPGQVVLPSTPDDLMAEFEQAYSQMNLMAYNTLLHEQYDFKFLATGRDAVPWSHELEIASTENMFNGNPGEILDGLISCTGVDSIRISEFIRLMPWGETGPDDTDFPDAEQTMYQVNIVFHVDDGANSFTIGTRQIFTVKGEEREQADGSTAIGYTICGQRDMLPTKGNVDLHWGDIKMMGSPGMIVGTSTPTNAT